MLYRLHLAERLGRTLAELDATMGTYELALWAARDEIDGMVQTRMNKHQGMTYGQALDQVRASWQTSVRRKR